MHRWFKKIKGTSFLDIYQSQPENSFITVAPILLSNVILPRFLQVQDFFYVLESLMQIKEMIALVYARHTIW